MQRMTSFASTSRELGGLAARSPLACPWKRRSSRQDPRYCPRSCVHNSLGSSRPIVRHTAAFAGNWQDYGQRLFACQKYRLYCTRDDHKDPRNPDVSVVGIPDPITWIRNKVHIFLIELYYDLGLTSGEFDTGAKQALVLVSNMMSSGKFHLLRGLVSREMEEYVELKYKTLSNSQRKQLAIKAEDIIFWLPEDVMLHFDDHGRHYCFIEIKFWLLSYSDGPEDPEATRVFKVEPSEDESKPQKRIVTAVYEFKRQLTTRSAPDDWVVTNIWHWTWKQGE